MFFQEIFRKKKMQDEQPWEEEQGSGNSVSLIVPRRVLSKKKSCWKHLAGSRLESRQRRRVYSDGYNPFLALHTISRGVVLMQ